MSEMRSRIMKAAAYLFDISAAELDSRSRVQHIMPARFAVYKALSLRKWSYSKIGKFLERDHTSILYGINRANYMIERDEAYAEKVLKLAAMRLTSVQMNAEKVESALESLREQHGWNKEYEKDKEWLIIQ